MHWEATEVLTLISGLIVLFGCLVLPEAELATRLRGSAGGVFIVAYAFWAASQDSGIILIPVAAWAAAVFVLFVLYAAFFAEEQ